MYIAFFTTNGLSLMKIVSSQEELENISANDSVRLESDIHITDDFSTISDFSGCINGDGYEIKGLRDVFVRKVTHEGVIKNISFSSVYLNSSSAERTGVIGINNGTVRSVQVEDSTIELYHLPKYSRSYVGMIVGENDGEIRNCSVSDSSSHARSYVGGIVGYTTGNVTNCTVCDYNSSGIYVGGICGRIESDRIQDCHAKDLTLNAYESCGGIVGTAAHFGIENTDVTNITIEKSWNSGGIVGLSTETSRLSNCSVSDSMISAYDSASGVVGICEESKITDSTVKDTTIHGLEPQGKVDVFSCKFDNDYRNTGKEINRCFSSDVTLYGEEVYLDYDYEILNSYVDVDIIALSDSKVDTYSNSSIYIDYTVNIQKNENKVVKISEASQLNTIGPFDTVKLTEDIDLSKHTNEHIKIFHGNFDGNNNTIYNISEGIFEFFSGTIKDLKLHTTNIQKIGFISSFGIFATKGTGKLRNVTGSLKVKESYVEDCLGGLVGVLQENGTIQNCTINGTVEHQASEFGGIAGSIERNTIIKDCESDMCVTTETGGLIVGSTTDRCKIIKCYSEGELNCETCGGGVIGVLGRFESTSIVKNCNSTASISGDVSGGIVGKDNNTQTIKNSTFSGKTTGRTCSGIIAESESKVTGCINNGYIKANHCAGGIVAKANGSKIKHCRNNSDILSDEYSGGLIGIVMTFNKNNTTLIQNSSNHGDVTGTNCVAGGLVGSSNQQLTINYSYTNAKVISKSDNFGPVIGRSNSENPINDDTVYWIQQDDEVYPESTGKKTNLTVSELHTVLQI